MIGFSLAYRQDSVFGSGESMANYAKMQRIHAELGIPEQRPIGV